VSRDGRWLIDGLRDLRDAGDIVALVVVDTDQSQYMTSPIGSLALERAVSNFGEAANRLHRQASDFEPDFEARHPELELRRAIKTRAVIVHDYDGVDRHLLWDTAINAVPRVTRQVDSMIREIEGVQTIED
jgi:uncharacterized protein with HEPN domain